MRENLGKILEGCMSAVDSVDNAAKDRLLDLIFSSERIFIYGSGRSGLIGQLFAVRLVQLGFDVHFVGEMTTPIIASKDLVILLSNTGKTSSVVQTAKIARRIGSTVVSLTSQPKSELSKSSDVTIVIKTDSSSGTMPLGSAFEDSAHLFFECLVCEIMERGGITEEDMRGRHAIWV
jgi:6-phospho-3-hexuloisomerase